MLGIQIQPWPCWWLISSHKLLTRSRKILPHPPSIQDLPQYCFCLLLRGKADVHAGYLTWKRKTFLSMCFFHLLVWNAITQLVASSAHLLLQGQGAGPSNCTSPEALYSSLTMISPSRETACLSSFIV